MPPDEVFLPSPNDTKLTHTIIFITGNPGVVGHYRRFLTALHKLLNEGDPDKAVAVYGRSLGGFEVNNTAEEPRLHSLSDQIDYVQHVVETVVEGAVARSAGKVRISLCGHSVGTYILLHVLQRYYVAMEERELPYRIEAGVLLFPTIIDLAKSHSGKRVGRLLLIPGFPTVFGTLAGAFVRAVPTQLLERFIRFLPEFKAAEDDNAQDQSVESTVAFLKSPLGIRECFSLAAEEMRQIASDAFSNAVWGSETRSLPDTLANGTYSRTKLFFYFGKDDHWVAHHTREFLMNNRACEPAETLADRVEWSRDSRPWMEVDQLGTRHDFCIGSNDLIARKASEYIKVVL